MLPHSFTKEVVGTKRPTYTESGNEDASNKDYDYCNLESDIILEDEEEYDVLNTETFGEPLSTEIPITENEAPAWDETYDVHNDETFGEEIMAYDWEAEHEKFVNIVGNKPESNKDDVKQSRQINEKNFILSSDIIKRNGYHKSNAIEKTYHRQTDNRKNDFLRERKPKSEEEPFKFPPVIIDNVDNSSSEYESHPEYSYNETYEPIDDQDEFGSTETLTNENCSKETKYDKWYNTAFDSSARSSKHNACDYSQGYSLFSSGANLLQTAGIHIPSVSTSSSVSKSSDSLENKFDSTKLQSSVSKIPSVADLEKQWINESASSSKSIINAECFRAYNSALYLNGNHTSSANDTIQSSPPKPSHAELFRPSNDPFPDFMNPQRIVDRTKNVQMLYGMEDGDKNLSRKFAGYPEPQNAADVATLYYRNTINYANINANILNSFTNTMILPVDASKPFPLVDLSKEPPLIIPSEPPTHIIEKTTILLDNARANQSIPGLLGSADGTINLSMFPPPPPGLSIDPSKMCHVPPVPPAAAAALQPPQPSSYLTLPPPQVLNGITTVEQQKQLMKMQKESSIANLSNVDEFAGMMTEREKYWLSGVQLLQINSMDPYKDDYYFTNYQARRKGNRNKNQNTTNSAWKNAHTKDYSPLQFENSLGRVQIGSVVAPRQVIDTYLIESSPKSKMEDIIQEDPIANTSSRKRKALMLHIENMYSKIMALESLQVNSGKIKSDPAAIKLEFTSIASALREEILNLKDDFKIIMSIKKGKRLVLRFLSFCDDPGEVWFEILKILDRIIRGDQEHGVLLSYLPYFRAWLTAAELSTLIQIAGHFQKNLSFYLQDKFSVSVIANMIEQAEQIYFFSKPEEQNAWMDFVINLAEIAHTSFDHIQKPVVSVKPQILRSHLLKCKKLENGYMSYLLKIFSNNTRK